MRWLWCSATLALATLGCPAAAHQWYTARPGEPALSPDQLRQTADLALRDHCQRLLQGRVSATGEATIVLEIDRDGGVRRTRVARSSGDRAIDDMFAQLATRMRVERVSSQGADVDEGTVGMGFSCSPNIAIATIRPNP